MITVSMKESPILEELAEGVVKDVQTNLKTRFALTIMFRVATRYLQYLKQIDRFGRNLVERKLRKSMKNSELIQLLDIEKSFVYFSSSLKANEIPLKRLCAVEPFGCMKKTRFAGRCAH